MVRMEPIGDRDFRGNRFWLERPGQSASVPQNKDISPDPYGHRDGGIILFASRRGLVQMLI